MPLNKETKPKTAGFPALFYVFFVLNTFGHVINNFNI